MICPKCKTENSEQAKFCGECGLNLQGISRSDGDSVGGDKITAKVDGTTGAIVGEGNRQENRYGETVVEASLSPGEYHEESYSFLWGLFTLKKERKYIREAVISVSILLIGFTIGLFLVADLPSQIGTTSPRKTLTPRGTVILLNTPTPIPTWTPIPTRTPTPTQGCVLFENFINTEITIMLTSVSDNRSRTFSIPPAGRQTECFDSGQYTYTIDAPPPWESTNSMISIAPGETSSLIINKN